VQVCGKSKNILCKKAKINSIKLHMLTCMKQHRAAMAEWYTGFNKAVLHSSIDSTSISGHISGWCRHGFKYLRYSYICWHIPRVFKFM